MRSASCILCLLLLTPFALAQKPEPAAARALEARIGKLRSLPDDSRAAETRKLALEIRAYPEPGDELALAVNLSHLATEGGSLDTLREVAATIADAIHKVHAADDEAYDELARLVHYEGVDVRLNDPRFQKAIAGYEARDRVRETSDFTLKDLSGKSWTLSKLRGKVVIVNFWATWCPPCRREMPDLEALYKRFSGEGLVILAISDEDAAKVRPFIAEQKYTYPILLDAGRAVNTRFQIGGIPVSLVYDRSGKLVAQSSDMRTMDRFLEMLRQAGLGK
ncbi:MAG TPA: TlpA disulfide reductase family protein [Bryobacteraceae bacterium]|nr:TlpA disulfide reductase family protein [Bryobacteraceae bacterium]